jgi:pimeloyl-ACP methyl ester carboxylesterase
MQPQPFRIHVEQSVLDDLQARLDRVRWSSVSDEEAWAHGTQPGYLRTLVAYWRDGFDWRRQEASLNAFPQFKGRVLDMDLHFIHARGRGPRSTPLLLLHGWPDSFHRYSKVIGGFAQPVDPQDASFDVVVPSIPGFAFSAPVTFPERHPTRHSASALWHLMTSVLGYERFAVAGGDGGSVLAQIMAIDHPESVLGVHLTDLGWHASDVADPSTLTRSEKKFLEASKKAFMADGAYAMVQATRPESLAASLNDSPVGLASWIVDRFHSWSDAHGDLENSFGKDEILTNVMLYWATQTIGSSMFTYFADRRSPSITSRDRVRRPVAMALFPKDLGGIPPRSLAERTLDVVRWTEMPRGSHFAALEEPALYEADVRAFFASLTGAPVRKPVRVRDEGVFIQEVLDERPVL